MIVRGTTPTLTFVTPFDEATVAVGFFIAQQNGETVLEKSFNDCKWESSTLIVQLTQEDTLAFTADTDVSFALVLLTVGGDRHESFKIIERVGDTAKDGVIK